MIDAIVPDEQLDVFAFKGAVGALEGRLQRHVHFQTVEKMFVCTVSQEMSCSEEGGVADWTQDRNRVLVTLLAIVLVGVVQWKATCMKINILVTQPLF